MGFSHFFHFYRICAVFIRFGLDEVVLAHDDLPHAEWLAQQAYLTGKTPRRQWRLFWPLRVVWFLCPWLWFRDLSEPLPVRLRLALETLGPLFVKFGQMLSTRPDLLSEAVVVELSRLQDAVPPFDVVLLQKVVVDCLGKPLDEVFAHFDVAPLASASIAQVHAAELLSGEKVVVKVLRPRILAIIQRDLALLRWFARLVARFSRSSGLLRPLAVVDEYEKIILNELDLLREAANAAQLKRNFEGSDLLYVPEVFWDFCRSNILVMERISGVQVSDVTTLVERKVDLKVLAERGVEIFFSQVFRDNFFHADMHPGNVFVSTDNPALPKYVAVDFGIMGSLSPDDKRYIAENLLAFFQRDYLKVARLHVESGWVAAGTSVDDFAATIRTVCEPIFQKPLNEISFAHVLVKLLKTARRYDMAVQPQLLLLQKTLLQVEGLGRQLFPELNLWSTALPFLEKWLRSQINPLKAFSNVKDKLPFLLEHVPLLPELAVDALKAVGRPAVVAPDPRVVALQCQVARLRWLVGVGFAGVVVGLGAIVWRVYV